METGLARAILWNHRKPSRAAGTPSQVSRIVGEVGGLALARATTPSPNLTVIYGDSWKTG